MIVFSSTSIRGGLKPLWQSGLLENAVRGMARPYFPIYWETEPGEGAVPDFVIPFALTFKTATIFRKDFFDDRDVVSHYWSGF